MLINKNKTEIYSIWKLGNRLCGHPNVIHGGLIASLYAQTVATLFKTSQGNGLLANHRILYLSPTLSNQNGITYFI